MVRARRVDGNHREIKSCFRSFGWAVLDIHTVPRCCDLIVSKGGVTIAVEVKDGALPPSDRKLTKGEQEFADTWRGIYRIVESVEDVQELAQQHAQNGQNMELWRRPV